MGRFVQFLSFFGVHFHNYSVFIVFVPMKFLYGSFHMHQHLFYARIAMHCVLCTIMHVYMERISMLDAYLYDINNNCIFRQIMPRECYYYYYIGLKTETYVHCSCLSHCFDSFTVLQLIISSSQLCLQFYKEINRLVHCVENHIHFLINRVVMFRGFINGL